MMECRDVGDPSVDLGLSRVKKGDHLALTTLTVAFTIEHDSAQVALEAKWPARLIVVENGKFDGQGPVNQLGVVALRGGSVII